MAITSIASPVIHGWQAEGLVHSCAERVSGGVLGTPARLATALVVAFERRRVLHEFARRDERVLLDMGLDAEAIRRHAERGIGVRRFGPQFPKV